MRRIRVKKAWNAWNSTFNEMRNKSTPQNRANAHAFGHVQHPSASLPTAFETALRPGIIKISSRSY